MLPKDKEILEELHRSLEPHVRHETALLSHFDAVQPVKSCGCNCGGKAQQK